MIYSSHLQNDNKISINYIQRHTKTNSSCTNNTCKY